MDQENFVYAVKERILMIDHDAADDFEGTTRDERDWMEKYRELGQRYLLLLDTIERDVIKTMDTKITPVPERADREGDTQPLPIGNDLPIAHDEVIKDLQARLALGIKRYGQPLQPFNGRKPLRDAYEEALDLAVYLWCACYETEHPDQAVQPHVCILPQMCCSICNRHATPHVGCVLR